MRVVQAIGADILVHPLHYNCRKSLKYLINQTHTWNRTAMSSEALALVIEVLEGKTYLDISNLSCDTNGQTSANAVPSTTLPSAPPAGTSLSARHNIGTARASVDPPYRNMGGTRPFLGMVDRNTGRTGPTVGIRRPDTDAAHKVLSAMGLRWGTARPPLTLKVGHQTGAATVSLRLHPATITTGQPQASLGADRCCIPEEQRPLENLLISILLETVGSCKDRPDPRVLIALRLSNRHNLSRERTLEDCLLKSYSEKTVGDGNFTTGDMGLYTLAFRASCINPANISNDNLGINLIRLLDTTLAIEMHALDKTKSYFTNSYQVSLAVLALCLENKEISINVAHDFVSFIINFEAPEAKNMTTGAKCSYILALSCLLNTQGHLKSIHARIQVAIQLLLSDVLQGLRADGSFGSVHDTGLVLQVLNAKLGPRIPLTKDIYNCSQSLQTMLQTIIDQTPPDTLSVVATLPALEGRSYLDIKQLCGSGESRCSEPGPLSLKILNGTRGSSMPTVNADDPADRGGGTGAGEAGVRRGETWGRHSQQRQLVIK
ncbi:cobalamin binding intrinsic factor-like isoform X1 [Rhincodon typus]|uniref:cobalamin binding intrinsic factor-like isoform X1 n=1 Tax=Rhincodon typus TaxID=259920 RepID=UPI00202E407B|nr:cobalamin binding intrinsic factor-like isoform X1 [Rhincodon typus]